MNAITNVYYEALSGPQRALKTFLLLFVPALGVLALLAAALGASAGALLFVGFACVVGFSALQFVYLTRTNAKLNDLHYELSMNRVLASRSPIAAFYIDGAAANPSLALQVLKVLDLCRPQRILELGSGQTTKLLAAYHHQHPDTYVLTIEHDEGWQQHMRRASTFNGRCHDIRHAPLREYRFTAPGGGRQITTHWYSADDVVLSGAPFNFVLVDGPNGSPRYSRSGIVPLLPQILAPSFVLIFDDADRAGELMTIDLAKNALDLAGIAYHSFSINGVKSQVVLCSTDLGFLRFT